MIRTDFLHKEKSILNMRTESGFWPVAGLCAALAVALFLIYGQTGRFGFVGFDDQVYITDNPHVRAGLTWEGLAWALASFYGANWHPLTWLSHMLDVEIFGLAPGAHHGVNLALHTANSILLFLFLRYATQTFWRSALVAAFFALHPLRVESVAWISERKDVLSALFGLLSLWAYSGYARHRSGRRYLLSWIFLSLGLMAKPMLVTFPLLMLLLDYWPLSRFSASSTLQEAPSHRASRLLLEKLPFLIPAILVSMATLAAQKSGGAIQAVPLTVRITNSLWAYAAYLGKAVWPVDLSVFYPHPGAAIASLPLLGAGATVGVLTAAVLLSGFRHPYLLTGWFWYLVALIPVIGIVQVGGQAMADRYTYIPQIGIGIAAVWGIEEILRCFPRMKGWVWGLTGVALVLLGVQAHRQAGVWTDAVTLFSHAVSVDPKNALAHHNLGVALAGRGDVRGALAHLRTAVTLQPRDPIARTNLGVLLLKSGDRQEAETQLKAALAMDGANTAAEYYLGLAAIQRGDPSEARLRFEKVISLDPGHGGAADQLSRMDQGGGNRNPGIGKKVEATPKRAPAHD